MNPTDLDLPPALLPRVGGMASMPSRADSLRRALPLILPQVDRLYLYLDQQTEVPADLASEPKIIPMLPEAPGRTLGCSGKLLGLVRESAPCLFFGFDDDILYAPGYADWLAAALRRHHHRCLVGLFGTVYRRSAQSYAKHRFVMHFSKAWPLDVIVDELGSGTIAFHSSVLDIDPTRWAHANMTDLMLMLEAIKQRVPRLSVRRPAGLATPIAENQADSIYRRVRNDDRVETRLLLAAMRAYPDAWAMSD